MVLKCRMIENDVKKQFWINNDLIQGGQRKIVPHVHKKICCITILFGNQQFVANFVLLFAVCCLQNHLHT